MPTLRFYLSTIADPIDSGHALWRQPLPDRRMPASLRPAPPRASRATYGDYFSAVVRFCASDGWALIRQAAARQTARRIELAELGDIAVFLEKHGAFYHPARLRVKIGDQMLSLVVNVAVSADGRRTLPGEVKTLERLGEQRPFGWLPRVYGYQTAEIPMFLGDWFDDFHEFHLTRQAGGESAVVVWDGAAAPRLLSKDQAADLYRQAAMILTACYDPVSTCQIFPWHHAAGDFVVRIDGQGVTVRLISARDYRPLAAPASEIDSERAVLDALAMFLILLSLRMRLDRVDGVGPVAWAPDACLAPMIDGFFQGLDLAARISGFPEGFPDLFRRYIGLREKADWQTTARRLTDAVFDRRTEERRVVDAHLDGHIRDLRRLLTN
jgi:hypothetical protein